MIYSSSSVTTPRSVRYVIISPVRNEAEFLDETIRCVVEQTIRPEQYILVDDGSSDSTLEIIQRWAAKYPWILPIHRSDSSRITSPASAESENHHERGKRAREAKEILAFYHGYEQLKVTNWDFLVKLDGDLGFDNDYFEKCFGEFERDPKMGVGGGVICHLQDNQTVVERNPQFHVRGATKIYRQACWEAIGGVTRGAGWDTLDETKANMLGWSSRSFPDLQVIHYRFTGAANGKWQNAVKKGEWNYISGYHPLFMAVKCVKHVFKRPHGKGAAGLFYGYMLAFSKRTARIDDPDLIRYIQGQQLRRLFFRPTIWR
ncbi:glycosyltransferase [Acidicapsa ligni]|uniref:glycosyltransferase n=1 Tax=Acidicapsa ligni TaxID=542300 RepID=UPI0021DF73E9|nr:glycosyltransferase family A protein [Acidicapsa ligni]